MTSSQNKYWLLILAAAAFEVTWVSGLKHADNPIFWSVTIAAIIISFALLLYSAKKLPTSTAYAVFVGLGTAGTVIVEMTVFREPFSWTKVLLIAILLIGILGLKLVTSESESKRDLQQQGGEKQ
ncbi:DMT family transporter [Paenibacillus soyae]|uniref:Multidrug efflux SMR transporter n=1 Tax=Paenibacillus soyae TaxID=2969249 RepID=A0A9X2S7A4_9BACL|nr:multidrug efflux SMR transporter [Paenibacillus soyae]MCR2802835.1 multidrug efflux SMR transporter [Paenibacillus soyae]